MLDCSAVSPEGSVKTQQRASASSWASDELQSQAPTGLSSEPLLPPAQEGVFFVFFVLFFK